MPELLLLRHAKSDWGKVAQDDFDRPLAPRGRHAAPLMGKYLRAQGLVPDLVICSSAKRAKETLELLLTALASTPQISYLKTLYLAPPSRLLTVLRRQGAETGRLLLIGHNPGLQQLALGLSGPQRGADRQRMADKYPTAALARFEVAAWSQLGEGPARLIEFVRPRDLDGKGG